MLNEATPWNTMAAFRANELTWSPANISYQDELFAPSLCADGIGTDVFTSMESEMSQAASGINSVFDNIALDESSECLGPFSVNGSIGNLDAEQADYLNAQFDMGMEPTFNNFNCSLNQKQGVDTHHPVRSPISVASQSQTGKGRASSFSSTLDTVTSLGMCGKDTSYLPLGSIETAASSLAQDRYTKGLASGSGIRRSSLPKFQSSAKEGPTKTYTNHSLQHQRMRELSELGLTLLCSQETDAIPGDDNNPLDLNRPDCLAVKVLEGSVNFFNLLTSSYVVASPSPNEILLSSSSDEEVPESDDPEFNYLSAAYASRDRAFPRMKNNGSKNDKKTLPVHDDSQIQPVDMTEVFSLLTCYIRILHLHSFFYNRLFGLLSAISQNRACMQPIFPGLQAGGVSLDKFACP